MLDGRIARARTYETVDGVTQLGELGQLSLDRGELLLCASANRVARCALPRAQREELFRLHEGEPQLRRVANEAQPGDCVLGIVPVALRRSTRFRKKPDPFVVTNRLHVYLGTPGEHADRERLVRHGESMGGVVDYRVK